MLYTKTFRHKDIKFSILIFHDKRPLISTNSEIKVALPGQKLCIKDCIQEANTSVWEWSQRENEAIVEFWAFYNFPVELRKQVTMRLHIVCNHSINTHHNMYILQSLFMIINLPHRRNAARALYQNLGSLDLSPVLGTQTPSCKVLPQQPPGNAQTHGELPSEHTYDKKSNTQDT